MPLPTVTTAPVNALVSHLLVVEPEKLYAMPDPAGPDGHLPAVATLCDLFDREIVVTISWAKSIPGRGPRQCGASLGRLGPARLWCSCLASSGPPALQASRRCHCLTRCQYCRVCGWRSWCWVWPSAPCHCRMSWPSPRTWSWMKRGHEPGLGELGAALLQLVRRLQALRLEREEYVLLKALALANSGESGACTDGFLHQALWFFTCDGGTLPLCRQGKQA